MSFAIKPTHCKKCNKPLGIFDYDLCSDCYEAEKSKRHEVVEKYTPKSRKTIPMSVIEDIKAEIDGLLNDNDSVLYQHGVLDTLEIINKHTKMVLD